MKITTTTILLILFPLTVSFAQPSVTSNSLLGWLGFKQIIQADTSGTVAVNVGAPGANQMWDFSGLMANTPAAEYEFFPAASTPYAADFADANYAFKIGITTDEGDGTMFQYVKLSSSSLMSLGSVMVFQGNVVARNDDNEITPLPITYGSAWQSVSADTFEIPGFSKTITTSTESHVVDGWGTIKLPSGEYNCLRWKTHGTLVTVTNIGGVDVPLGSYTFIDYTWIGENSLLLASVSSLDDETDPDFTMASGVTWLSDVQASTLVASDETTPSEFKLLGNYPNPFNPSTTISFELTKAQEISLSIYDVSGRLVRQYSQSLSAGANHINWDSTNLHGEDVSAGAYLYELKAGSQRAVGRMVLVR